MTVSTETKMPDAFQQSRLLSVRQAQEMLGVSKKTIHRLLGNKTDPIPSVKIGHSRKFQLDKLLWWIEKHEQ
jgi:excisionase family DNA binding protein